MGHQRGFWQCLQRFSRCLPFISSEGSIEAAVKQKASLGWPWGNRCARDLPVIGLSTTICMTTPCEPCFDRIHWAHNLASHLPKGGNTLKKRDEPRDCTARNKPKPTASNTRIGKHGRNQMICLSTRDDMLPGLKPRWNRHLIKFTRIAWKRSDE